MNIDPENESGNDEETISEEELAAALDALDEIYNNDEEEYP